MCSEEPGALETTAPPPRAEEQFEKMDAVITSRPPKLATAPPNPPLYPPWKIALEIVVLAPPVALTAPPSVCDVHPTKLTLAMFTEDELPSTAMIGLTPAGCVASPQTTSTDSIEILAHLRRTRGGGGAKRSEQLVSSGRRQR